MHIYRHIKFSSEHIRSVSSLYIYNMASSNVSSKRISGGAPITLLKKGSLVARMGEDQEELDQMIPIDYIMNWFKTKLLSQSRSRLTMSDRVVILLSKTGSGKSTSIAPNLYLRFFQLYKKRIVITQPRVLTAVEIPKDIAQIDLYKKKNRNGNYIKLFENLGYQTQEFVKKTKNKGILFTTTGILLQYLKNMTDEDFIRKFRFIIIDEAHDRSVDIDLILFLMKQLIQRNLGKDPPFLILMSATLNVDEYSAYFKTNTIFEVSGQSKPIEIRYPKYDISNIFTHTAEIIKSIQAEGINSKGPNDVIIFMPNTSYISKMTKTLETLNESESSKFLIIPITSLDINHSSEEYRRLISPIDNIKLTFSGKQYKPCRRIIISTNVAETGLTLESLKYCIDTALVFTSEFNPKYGATMLYTKPTTTSMSLQRKGRVGRKHAGVFYPLFTESTFESMIVDNTPNILVEDMSPHMLALAAGDNLDSITQMITPPSYDTIAYAKEKLFVLGAINQDQKITPVGVIMNRFRKMDLELRKTIITAVARKRHVYDTMVLACVMMVKKTDMFLLDCKAPISLDKILLDSMQTGSPNDATVDLPNFNRLRSKLLVACEFIEMLLIYKTFVSKISEFQGDIIKIKKWCLSNGLNYTSLAFISDTIIETSWLIVETLKINPLVCDDTEDVLTLLHMAGDRSEFVNAVINIKRNLYEGYKLNILTFNQEANQYFMSNGTPVSVNSKLTSNLSSQREGAKFRQTHPNVLLYKNMLIRKDDAQKNYNFEASIISVMDGYVDIDDQFISS